MNMIWDILQPDRAAVQQLACSLAIDPLVATVLVNRRLTGLETAQSFLRPALADITPPGAIKDMESAARRLIQALVNDEKILIFGDYDVDGITATALLLEFLRKAGARVSHYIPHRRKEGYGLKPIHIEKRVIPGDYRLVITVDCGISSFEAVEAAAAAGVDVIISDHHRPSSNLPAAVAVINPQREDCTAGLEHLAGVGMAFYLLIELRRQLRSSGFWQRRPEPDLKALCSLVALGTIADMVPLVKENRAFIRTGLPTMGDRPGLKALMDVCRISSPRMETDDVAFRLAPRLNAAGRMAHANLALRLLTTDSPPRARRLALSLDRLNARRQCTEAAITDQIRRQIAARPALLDRHALLMAESEWHEGVLGIVAARLARDYSRPVLLLSRNGSFARGSARSIPGIDLYRLLTACQSHLDHFGGHSMAAGLCLSVDRLAAFEQQVQRQLAQQTKPEDYRRRLILDAEMALDQINPRLLDQLESLQPFGQAVPEPLFMLRDIAVASQRVVGGHHRQMVLKSGQGTDRGRIQAIQFNIDPQQPPPAGFARLAFHLRWNRWNDSRRPQLVVQATDPETGMRP